MFCLSIIKGFPSDDKRYPFMPQKAQYNSKYSYTEYSDPILMYYDHSVKLLSATCPEHLESKSSSLSVIPKWKSAFNRDSTFD